MSPEEARVIINYVEAHECSPVVSDWEKSLGVMLHSGTIPLGKYIYEMQESNRKS